MATQTNALKTTATPAKAKAAQKKTAPVKTAKAAKATTQEILSKRITPGTPIKEYRIRKSQRKATPGYFVQGGQYRMVNDENQFFVAVEQLHADLTSAKTALEKITAKPGK